ncbi:MAG TPA: hypothetical protein VE826_11290 [Dongiaceae bacterium]|nr:hypothetical protein [Dongiaceae bacterium]
MGALFVTVALFAIFAFVGYPVVYELLDGPPLRRILLAPVTGLCVLTVPVATLNHVGFPVSAVGRPVLFAALLAAGVYCVLRRPRVAWRAALPFAAIAALALVVTAWPMAVFSFDWLSFGNDDMTTYLLGGNHFFAHGYFQLPSVAELVGERDPSWNTSFFYSFDEVRYASPLMLAWVMSVAGLSSGAAFMPMIVALHLVVIVSAGALLAARDDRGRAALVGCLLLALSANLVSGTLRQLLPQDFGLAVLAGAAAVLMRPPPRARRALVEGGVLAALFVGTLVIAYPEVLPFLVVPAAVYAGLSIARARTEWRSWALLGGLAALGAILIANENLPGEIAFLLRQAQVATATGAAYDRGLFAAFLTPLVFPLLWGFATVGAAIGPWSVFAVICGTLATAGAVVAAVRYSVALEPSALVLLVMFGVFVELMLNGGSFGLFKLVMYVQPFLLSTLACVVVDVFSARAAQRPA